MTFLGKERKLGSSLRAEIVKFVELMFGFRKD